jgi:hypothetical protein
MKALIVALMLVAVVAVAGDSKPQQCKVIFTITYEPLTLGEATAIEARLRVDHPKAKEIEVELRKTYPSASVPFDTTGMRSVHPYYFTPNYNGIVRP